ncbi:hypothetical protein JOC34_000614 [Virgibacillus halotolerans]|nr:hypothetical protein [Virgibacillus halotolerans]
MIDLPEYMNENINTRYLLQQKVFEFVDMRPIKYIKDYKVLYRSDKNTAVHIEKLIKDWDLEYEAWIPVYDSNKARVDCIKSMSIKADEALIFYSNKRKDEDIGNKIMLDQCVNSFNTYLKICRLDLGNKIN